MEYKLVKKRSAHSIMLMNVGLYLNVRFVTLYMLLYKGPRGRQQLLSWSLNFVILTFI